MRTPSGSGPSPTAGPKHRPDALRLQLTRKMKVAENDNDQGETGEVPSDATGPRMSIVDRAKRVVHCAVAGKLSLCGRTFSDEDPVTTRVGADVTCLGCLEKMAERGDGEAGIRVAAMKHRAAAHAARDRGLLTQDPMAGGLDDDGWDYARDTAPHVADALDSIAASIDRPDISGDGIAAALISLLIDEVPAGARSTLRGMARAHATRFLFGKKDGVPPKDDGEEE